MTRKIPILVIVVMAGAAALALLRFIRAYDPTPIPGDGPESGC